MPRVSYAAYDCNLRRTDLLAGLASALADASRPAAGSAIDSANLLALEAVTDLLRASADVTDAIVDITEGGPVVAVAPSAAASADVEKLLETRATKTRVQTAAAVFNEKPKRGMEALQV